MTQTVKEALEAVGIAIHDNSFESDECLTFAEKMVIFLKHIRREGLAEPGGVRNTLAGTWEHRLVGDAPYWSYGAEDLFKYLIDNLEAE